MAKKPNIIEKIAYKDSEITIVEKEHKLELQVDGKPVPTGRDADIGDYFSSEIPYHEFGSLMEVGKAIVEMREKQRQKSD